MPKSQSDLGGRSRAYRIEARRKKLSKALKTTTYMPYPRSIYPRLELVNGKWVAKYIKHRKNSRAEAYCKRRSAKAVRRSAHVPARGNGYRRIYDYWWSID